MRAAYAGLYIEPTDAAMGRVAAARLPGIAASAALVAITGGLAALSGRPWLAVLGLPGVLAGGWLVLSPSSHGAAFLYGLGASVVALPVAAVAGHSRRRRHIV